MVRLLYYELVAGKYMYREPRIKIRIVMKYIDAELLRKEIEEERKSIEGLFIEGDNNFYDGQDDAYNHTLALIDSLQQEQPDKESLNESQQEFVNIVTERMLKEGPIPTLKGKQKAEFEKEFNRFKQIAGMVNWPAYEEIYKKIILWFMTWGADNLQNLNKVTDPDELDFQQGQPSLPSDLDEAAWQYAEQEVKTWGSTEPDDKKEVHDDFIAGAEWQREQMMKEAVDGYVNYYEDSGGILMAEAQVGCPYHNGDKVRIVVLKAEEDEE